MANSKNLIKHQFTSENQPAKRGRPKGSHNRKNLLRKWLEIEDFFDNPLKAPDAPLVLMSVESRIILALIKKAISGDLASIIEIQDTMYGKIKNTVEMEQQSAQVVLYVPENNR